MVMWKLFREFQENSLTMKFCKISENNLRQKFNLIEMPLDIINASFLIST